MQCQRCPISYYVELLIVVISLNMKSGKERYKHHEREFD